MRCEDASRALYAGESDPELKIHLSACEECRLLAEDLAQIRQAFDRARAEWVPSPAFRVTLPAAPWKKLAIAASILVLPLFGWALLSVRPPAPSTNISTLLDPRPPAPTPSDREILATIFPEVRQP